MKLNSLAKGFAAITLAGCGMSAIGGAVSDPFVANTYKSGAQSVYAAAAGGNGDLLLLWVDSGRGGNHFIQRFDGNGIPLQSDDWFVGQVADGAALDRFGNFAIVTVEPDGNGKSLFVTVYSRDGTVKIAKFKVNTTSESNVGSSHLAFNASGQLAVFWGGVRTPGDRLTPYVRTFSAGGIATSAQTLVTDAGGDTGPQGVGIDSAGNVGVCWTAAQTPTDLNVHFRRFSNTGLAQTGVVLANTYTDSSQFNCSLAMAPSGDSVVTWQSNQLQSDGVRATGVYGQRFGSGGSKLGSEFRVNVSTSADGSNVAATDEGNFVVSWYSDNRSRVPSSMPTVFMRQFTANGAAAGGETPVFVGTSAHSPYLPVMAVDPAGNGLVGWRAYLPGGDVDVYARRIAMDTQPAVTTLSNSIPATGLSGAAGTWSYFKIAVPAGRPSLTIALTGPGTGDANLYGRLGAFPATSQFDVVSSYSGNSDTIVINNVPAGVWYFGVYGAAAYTGVSISATY